MNQDAGMSGPVFGEWIYGGTESLRPACEVGSGKNQGCIRVF